VASTIATAVRVIDSVHNNASDGWTDTHFAFAAGFTYLNVLVLFVTDCANCGHAVDVDQPRFAAWQAH
jgi:hypothetical protein